MSNPFYQSLDGFRGQRCRVVSNDGREFEGWVERVHHQDRHVALRGAVRLDEDEETPVGSVMVAHADVIETVERERIEAVALEDTHPAPYHAAEFERERNLNYIATVRSNGWAGSFPVVREQGDGYEVVEGHKRLWVAEQAGLDEHPVEIVDVDDWEVAHHFVSDHLPDEEQVRDDGSTSDGCYGEAEIVEAIEALVDEWGERAFDLERLAFNAERLEVGVGEEAADQEEVEEAEDVQNTVESGASSVPSGSAEASDVQGAEESDDRMVVERVEDALDEEGELPTKDLKQLTHASQGAVHRALSELQDEGRVASRKDPEDGRRKLYRLVDAEEQLDEMEETEEAPETDGQDDPTPDADWGTAVEPDDEGDQDDHQIGDPVEESDGGALVDESEDDDEQESSADEAALQARLPNDVTVQDVHDAVDERGPKGYLGKVAHDLGMDGDVLRTVLFQVDRYGDVIDSPESKFRGESA